MSATSTSPQASVAGGSRWQGFGAPKATVQAARIADAGASPRSAKSPDGRSAASTGRPDALTAAAARRAAPASGRERPVPKRASIAQSHSASERPSSRNPAARVSGVRTRPTADALSAFRAASPRYAPGSTSVKRETR